MGMLGRACVVAVCLLGFARTGFTKDPPSQTLTWPESGSPVLRFTFAKFKKIGGVGGEATYITDTSAQNLGSKRISRANFKLYLFDDKKTRIGEALLSVSDVAPGETIKFQTTIATTGNPFSVAIVADYLPPELGAVAPAKIVSLTVNSIPQGAHLKVDGTDSGTTPKVVQLTTGKHRLEFSKEGFNAGSFPLEIAPNDASGGSVSYELGSAVHDTVELRDGSVLNGDVESVSAADVVVRIGGKDGHYDRNQVKRILFVERESPQALPPAAQPSSGAQQ